MSTIAAPVTAQHVFSAQHLLQASDLLNRSGLPGEKAGETQVLRQLLDMMAARARGAVSDDDMFFALTTAAISFHKVTK